MRDEVLHLFYFVPCMQISVKLTTPVRRKVTTDVRYKMTTLVGSKLTTTDEA